MTEACKEQFPDIWERYEGTGSVPPALEEKHKQQRRLYAAVRATLQRYFAFDPDGGTTDNPANFPDNFGKLKDNGKINSALRDQEKQLFVAVTGLLLSKHATDPSMSRLDTTEGQGDFTIMVTMPGKDPERLLVVASFITHVTDAVKEYNAAKAVFDRTYRELVEIGKSIDGTKTSVFARQVAEIGGRLAQASVSAIDAQFRVYVENALAQVLGQAEGNSAFIDVSIPDLDAGVAADILPDNVNAVALIYFGAMLEELKFFATMERIAEHFSNGVLPLSRGDAGERIYEWIKNAPLRISEMERRSLYGRTLGLAQGAARQELTNRDFQDLWVRFLSSVNMLARENLESIYTQGAVSGNVPRVEVRGFLPSVWVEQVHKNARDLATNVSVHGYGAAHFAAVEVQSLVRSIIDIFRAPDVLTAYGVNDHWQLVERVSQLYLGGSMNSVRYRTMADAGGKVLMWLARAAPLLSPVRTADKKVFLDPTLTQHVDRWLAVTGTVDSTINRYRDTVDLPQQPTIPQLAPQTALPSAVRSALERVGMSNLGALPNIGTNVGTNVGQA